jgi:hypothetical protein
MPFREFTAWGRMADRRRQQQLIDAAVARNKGA